MINYYLLTKPNIILGNLITVVAGFLLAAQGQFLIALFLQTLLGLSLVIASACVFNNYIDRFADKKMKRTCKRPLVTGAISTTQALLFGTLLGVLGFFVLYRYTNFLTLAIALLGFGVYVLLYSLCKSKTLYATAIGSIAGAVPPLVGYTAVSGRLDAAAYILFAMLILWQMPHFFSIAIYRLEDYRNASTPLLPIERGMLKTKVHMLLYIFAFFFASTSLSFFNYTGYIYMTLAGALSLAWLWLCLKGFSVEDETKWAGQMFKLSLVVITLLSLAIPFDLVH